MNQQDQLETGNMIIRKRLTADHLVLSQINYVFVLV